jgi:hypothetical protein
VPARLVTLNLGPKDQVPGSLGAASTFETILVAVKSVCRHHDLSAEVQRREEWIEIDRMKSQKWNTGGVLCLRF